MGSEAEFNEAFNWWYLLGIVGALVAFSLLPFIAWVARLILL